MDRRGSTETSEQHRDEQFQKALDVILESYKGGASERLYQNAIACFEGLMEISQNTDGTKDFSRRKGIDLKYLVDGANFVISRMHFNAENNFYLTLGLPRNARADEIRERWKRLMFLYHPDRQTGNEEWVSERAKKVNEAYSVLKDEQKRAAYDQQLIDAALRQEHLFPPAEHVRAAPKSHARGHGSLSKTPERPLGSLRKYFTRILVGFYAVCILGVAAFIYSQNGAPDLESRLLSGEKPGLPAADPKSAPGELPAQEAGKKKEISPEPAVTGSGGRFVSPEPQRVLSGRGKEEAQALYGSRKQDEGMQLSRETKKPGGGRLPLPQPDKDSVPSQPGLTGPEKKVSVASLTQILKPLIPQSAPTVNRADEVRTDSQRKEALVKADEPAVKKAPEEKAPARPEQPESMPLQEAKAQPVSGARADGIAREEAEDFIKRFIRAYEKSDLDMMMSLFSRSAVENNTLRYQDIRNAYRSAFDGRINYYQLRDMQIRMEGPAASVTGSYSINRYSSADDRWAKFSGKITWKLIREHDGLKIISLNYDR